MSKKPVEIATGPFIFKDISARGFSLGTWVLEPGNAQKVEQMFAELQRFIVQGKFAPPPAKIVPLDKFKGAIENAICK
jgi:trans-2-enoyl-CoA reductase